MFSNLITCRSFFPLCRFLIHSSFPITSFHQLCVSCPAFPLFFDNSFHFPIRDLFPIFSSSCVCHLQSLLLFFPCFFPFSFFVLFLFSFSFPPLASCFLFFFLLFVAVSTVIRYFDRFHFRRSILAKDICNILCSTRSHAKWLVGWALIAKSQHSLQYCSVVDSTVLDDPLCPRLLHQNTACRDQANFHRGRVQPRSKKRKVRDTQHRVFTNEKMRP